MHPITESPAYQKAFALYLRKGISPERTLATEAAAQPTTHYIWRTRGDAKVRASHAANNGKIFAWKNPPPTGHPGADFGCRCTAEPYVRGVSEYAYQHLLSDIQENSSSWDTVDFFKHYYFGGGRAVTLTEAGHLTKVRDYYFYDIIREGKNTYERVNAQIVAQTRNHSPGNVSYHFENSYTELGDYMRAFGGGVITGDFNGTLRQEDGMVIIEGTVDYRYSDTFTDIFNLRQHIIGTSEPLDSSIAALLLTDVGGHYFDIVGVWKTQFKAAVRKNSADSHYP